MPKEQNKSFVLRIDAQTMESLEQWSADEFRSINGQLQWIIADALRRAGRKPRAGAKNAESAESAGPSAAAMSAERAESSSAAMSAENTGPSAAAERAMSAGPSAATESEENTPTHEK